MHLNTLSPAKGARKNRKRVGRGIGCTDGKTCGRGHKGQKSRRGASRMAGFEGGQMPLQRRIPKFGFNSRKALVTTEVRLDALNKIQGDTVDLLALQAADLVTRKVKHVKIIGSGKIEKSLTVRGLGLTQGAKAAIEAAGGKVED